MNKGKTKRIEKMEKNKTKDRIIWQQSKNIEQREQREQTELRKNRKRRTEIVKWREHL